MKKIQVLDTTLRDGEQTPYVCFTKKEKIAIAKALDELGVDMIEAGIPAMGKAEMESIAGVLALQTRAQILTWNRMNCKDIESSICCGTRNVHIAAPVSDLHIDKKLKQTKNWVLASIRKTVAYAVGLGLTVSVGAEDASRADPAFLLAFYKAALEEGAVRVRFADTVGAMDPFGVFEVLSGLKEHIAVPIDFHGHNDFGMATANAFAAIKAGAQVISCSVNGLGERAGNTPLEEIVMAAKHIAGKETGVHTERLRTVSALVEECAGRRVAEGKAVVGSQVFFHESGIHVDGLLKDERMYHAFLPAEVGAASRFVLGKFSGGSAVAHFCAQKGIRASTHCQNDFLCHLREYCQTHKPAGAEKMMEDYFGMG